MLPWPIRIASGSRPSRGFQRLLALLGNGVVEADDAVFLDFHCGTRLGCRPGRRQRKGCGGLAGDDANGQAQANRPRRRPRIIPASPPPRQREASPLACLLAGTLLSCRIGRLRRRPRGRPIRASDAAAWPVVAPADPVAANAVLMRAISLVGTPYRYGGNTPEGGFDCSGLVNYVYRDTARPAAAADLARAGRGSRARASIPSAWPPATWCSSASAAASPTSASTWAKGASCMPPARAARCGWISWTDLTGRTTTAELSGSCAESDGTILARVTTFNYF